MTPIVLLKLTVFLALVCAAAWTDARERRIPNSLTLQGLGAGLLFGVLLQGGFPVSALLGAGLGFALTFPLFALGALGAGDAKLLMAVGAFLGPAGLVTAALYAGALGGLLAIAVAARDGMILPVLSGSKDLALHVVTFGRRGHRPTMLTAAMPKIPYGVAIAGGAVLAAFLPLLGPGVFLP